MANAPQYDAAAARADKNLEPDGSIQTLAGTVVSGPDAGRAAQYAAAAARADKLLQPNGSIITSGSGGGGSTPPGGVTGQVQYNNGGAFAGTSALTTDGSTAVSVANATAATSGANANSGALNLSANYWNGSASAVDNWTIQNIPNAGTSPTTVLNFTHSGSSGGQIYLGTAGGVLVPNNGWIGQSGSVCNYYGGGINYNLASTAVVSRINTNYIINCTASGAGFGPPTTLGVVAANGACLDVGNASNASPGINRSSGQQNFTANYYTGSASAQDYWSIQNVTQGTGNNPACFLTIGHSGSPGGGILQVNAPVKTAVYTVATLPAASAALQGARATVTDATAPTFLGTLTGGGSVVCPVFCTGAAWLAG